MNIRDIARLARVTPGTVSKVLNNYPDISEATRQHVLKIIEENQYDPKANARTSKTAPENTRIGLVVEGVYNSLHSEIEDTLSLNIHNAGYAISSFHDNYFAQDKQEKMGELKSYVERNKLAGLIYIGGNFTALGSEEFATLPCPTIFLNTVLPFQPDTPDYSSIQVDHYETACAQMRYLVDRGHLNICTVISSAIDNSVYGLRAQAYQDTLVQSGLSHNLSHFLESDYQCEKAYAVLSQHLRLHPEISAICCETDSIIPGVIRAIHDAGRLPGEDVEIISFDGLKSTQYCIPSISTFVQPVQEMVRYTFDLLLGLINKEREHQHIIFRPLFIRRESC